MKGLEPPHLAASDPKSDVSTNFTTSGKEQTPDILSKGQQKYGFYLILQFKIHSI